MRIQTKLLLGFFIISVLAAAEGYWVLFQLREVSKPLNKDIPLSIEQLSKTAEIDGLAQLIRYYDEVLTHSARNYAFTGDSKWKRRYYAFEPLLDAAIKQAIDKCDEKDKGVFKRINKSNALIIGMEYDALDRIKNENQSNALEILESHAYWEQKRIYKKALREYYSKRGIQYEHAFETSMVTIRMSAKHAREVLRDSLRLMVIFILVIITLSLLIGFAITRSIVIPIKMLIQAAGKICDGDLSHRVNTTAISYEIGVLSRSFNQMTDNLTRANFKLREAKDELEKRVEERTADLIKTNNMLQLEINERIRAEENLKKAKEEAVSANQAKSEFLANMSHEIRTPMNAVIGFSDLLSSLITDKKQKNYLESIRISGRSLLKLINDVLDLSKIEAGRLEIEYEPVNPHMILNEIKQIFQIRISEKNLDFIIDVDEALPTALMLDETRLRQILFNLVGNAVKFTETGHIRLSAQKECKIEDRSTLDLVISIEDTGIGIPQDQIQSVFESFRQQDGQSTRKYGGTGLGLAITKRLIEMMNGQIDVRSTAGKGSVFEMRLRDVEVSSVSMAAVSPDISFDIKNVSFENAQILIVDDIESNRKLIKESLTLTGLDISEAENGQQAVLLSEESSPDLILMDIRMPVMDGYEATEILKANPKTKDIPIIALTASVGMEEPKKIKQTGFNGYLSKPVILYDLIKELSRYLKYHEKDAQITTNTHEDSSAADNAEEIENLPGLIKALDTEIMPEWKDLKGAMEMDVIEDFARKLTELSQAHNYKPLKGYADNLTEFVQSFDIEQIEHTLNEFPVIYDKVKGIGRTV
ncbi:ATP-binding protein [Desulfococcaceae bacterium HSG8]|nr:ATP-binding protein [Desulfococcaceae bacterium HSG8]